MLERLSKTHRNIGLGLIAALLLWFGWSVRAVLNPLILGYLLAYILRPMVQRLEDRGMGRRAAVNIIFALTGVAIVVVGGGLFVQGRQFVDNLIHPAEDGVDPFTRAEARIDELLESSTSWLDGIFGSDGDEPTLDGDGEPVDEDGAATDVEDAGGEIDDDGGAPSPATGEDGARDGASDGEEKHTAAAAAKTPLTLRHLVRAWVRDWQSANLEGSGFSRAQAVLGYMQRIFGGVMSVLGFLILLPVYTYFLLFELERIHDFIRSHIPKRERERVTRIGRKVGAVIANFFRGRLLICLLKGLVLAVGLTILQVPYGFLLGIVSGFLALVPFVGPTIGFAMTTMIALQSDPLIHETTWTLPAIWVAPLFVLAEFLEGYVFIPKILGDTLGLHPVVILLSVFVGGAALGLFGFLIAIPLAATLIILFRELVMPAIQDFAEEDSHTDQAGSAEPADPSSPA